MGAYFAEELADTARKGLVNHLSGVKLVNGELSEAWERADERLCDGRDALFAHRTRWSSAPRDGGERQRRDAQEITELWTFQRPRGASSSDWWLSAIQQA